MKGSLKVKKATLYLVGWIIVLLFNNKFFHLYSIPDSLYAAMGSTSRVIVGTLCVIFGIISLFISRKHFLNKEGKKLKRFVFVYTVVILCTALYTIIVYNLQPSNVAYKYTVQYLIIFEVFPLAAYMNDEDRIEKILKLINWFVLISNVLLIVQQLAYAASGVVFLQDINIDLYRSGLMRIAGDAFSNFMVIYNFYCIFYKDERVKEKNFNIFCEIIGLIVLIAVQQTRMYILTVLLVDAIIVLSESRKIKKFRISLIIITVSVIFLAGTGYINDLVSSFSASTMAMATSRNNRLYAFSYYFSVFCKHPLFGMAFARNNVYFSLVHGPLGIADLSDVGFVGQMATLGIGAFIIYIPIVYYLFKTAYKSGNKVLLIAAWYVLLTSPTLIILTAPLMVQLPFFLALAYYENTKEFINCRKQYKYLGRS